jgi:hypothetical protein
MRLAAAVVAVVAVVLLDLAGLASFEAFASYVWKTQCYWNIWSDTNE